jgi:hypothetical protein
MKIVTASLAALWLCVSFASPARSAEEFRGAWTLSKSQQRGKVQFGLTLRKAGGASSRGVSDWPALSFNTLDLTTGGKHAVTFVIDRAVGRIECNGFIEDGEGSGAFKFTLSQKYLESLHSRGFGDSDESAQFAMAVHDLSENRLIALRAPESPRLPRHDDAAALPVMQTRTRA